MSYDNQIPMTPPTLEQRLTEIPKEASPARVGSASEFIADTTACVTFGWVVGGLNETFVIGLPTYQMIASRAANTVLNVCVGGLYGKYTNLVDRLCGVGTGAGKIKQAAVDIASNALFWVPMYEALLRYAVGVTDEQALYSARVSALTLCAVTGWPLNAYRRYVRGLFGYPGNIGAKCDDNTITSG